MEETETLKNQIKLLTAQCKEQESNLLLAAEIGQQLLQENENLKKRCQFAVESRDSETQTSNTGDSNTISLASVSSSIVVDRDWLSDLESKVEGYMEENKILRDDHSLQARELSKTICEFREENGRLRDKMKSLDDQLQKAKEEIASRIAKEQQVFEPLKKKVKSLSCHEKAMDERIEQLEKENQQLAWEVKNASNASIATEERLRLQLDDLQDALEKTQNEAVEKGKESEWLQVELDHVRNMLLEKQNELELVLKRKSVIEDSASDAGDREEGSTSPTSSARPSLFNEVEDRRLELECQHAQLKDVHHGLMAKHDKAIRQQRKLSSHVKRMSQVTSSVGSTLQSTERLQQALSKAMQEKRELFEMVQDLQKKVTTNNSNSNSSIHIDSTVSSHHTTANFSEIRARQLAEECESLTSSLQSLKSQLFESQSRIRMMEMKITEQTKIIDIYKIKDVQAQVEADLDDGDQPPTETFDVPEIKPEAPVIETKEDINCVIDKENISSTRTDDKENISSTTTDEKENISSTATNDKEIISSTATDDKTDLDPCENQTNFDSCSSRPARIVIAPTTTRQEKAPEQCNQQ